MHPELKNTWTPAVNVLTWFMLVTAILSVLTRLGTKYFFFRKFTFDDGLAASSIVFCIAESIAVSMATANGLGQHYKMLAEIKVDNMMKVWDLLWLVPKNANVTNGLSLSSPRSSYSLPAFLVPNCRCWYLFAT